tara:strand:- start:530 stop:718 length:189 start_codon:yes stop_codon:yes gene_type:complete
MTIIKIVQAFFPVAIQIVKDIKEAQKKSSEGGTKITEEERAEIIFNAVTDSIPLIERIVMDL